MWPVVGRCRGLRSAKEERKREEKSMKKNNLKFEFFDNFPQEN